MKPQSLWMMSMLLVGAMLITACDGGGSSGRSSSQQPQPSPPSMPASGDPAYTAPNGADLSAVMLSAPVAAALGSVELSGLPSDLSSADLYASYYVSEGEFASEADDDRRLFLYTYEGSVYLIPPLLDAEGDSIVVVITDGASRSEAFELHLEALPPARDGVLDEVLAAVDRLLKAATKALDKDYPGEWEDWRDASLNQMPAYLMPLMYSWHAMLDEENENALINQNFDAETSELLARIFDAAGIVDALNGEAEFIESGASLLDSIAATSVPLRSASVNYPQAPLSGLASMSMMARPMQPELPPNRWEIEGLVNISDAPTLADWLNSYEKARKTKRDLELIASTLGAYLGTIAAVGSLPLGPGGAATVTASRATALKAVSSVTSTLAKASGMSMWFVPCCIVELDTSLDPEGGLIAHEDALPNQVKLRSAVVAAESEGVDLTRKLIEGIIKDAAKVASNSINDAVTDLYGESVSEHLGDDYGMSAMAEQFMSQFPPGADMVFQWEGIDLMARGEVQKWLDVEIDTLGASGRPILTEEYVNDDSYEFSLNEEAFGRTDSLLRFSVNQNELQSQTSVAIDTQQIRLRHIEVTFEPNIIRLEEGDTAPVPFSVTVKNSLLQRQNVRGDVIEYPALEPATGTIEYVQMAIHDGVATIHFDYIPPADFPEGTNVEVSTRSTSTTGLRGMATAPERSGSMFITLASDEPIDIKVMPETSCVENGKTLQLSVQDAPSGDPVANASWQTDRGSVSGSGLFTAPSSGSGEARIVATSESGLASAGVTMVYGDCKCWWNGSVSGFSSQSHTAVYSTSIRLNGASEVVQVEHHGDGDVPGFTLDFSENPIPPGAKGTYLAMTGLPGLVGMPGGLGNFSTDASKAWANPDPWGVIPAAPLEVIITTHEMLPRAGNAPGSRSLAGSVSGRVISTDLLAGSNRGSGGLDARWSGVFSFAPPAGGALNCRR